jgi:hypothetical protein
MITSAEILPLTYTSDLTESGIAYACRTLNYTYNRVGGTPYSRLRRIVGNVAVELAFRRYLSEQNIPFEVKNMLAFTDPERYDVSLGGHRCDVKSYLITRRPQISDIRQNRAILLRAPALIPSDQFAAETHSDQDLYLFAFISGLVAASQEDIQKAVEANQPTFLMHAFPKEWTHPHVWQPLGNLALKSESEKGIMVEIGGQNANREFITTKVELPCKQRVEIGESFYSLSYVHAEHIPEGRIAIHSPVRKETYIIPSVEWGNIWIYGMDIWLTGYIAHEEFRRRASFVAEGSHVFQYKETRTKNLAVPIADLHPLGDLFARVKEWEEAH